MVDDLMGCLGEAAAALLIGGKGEILAVEDVHEVDDNVLALRLDVIVAGFMFELFAAA